MDYESPTQAPRWPLLRVQARHDMLVTLSAKHLLRLSTHFCGQTFLCAGHETCELCHSVVARDLWYAPIVFGDRAQRGFLELSAVGAMELDQACKFAGRGNLLGCKVRVWRKTGKSPIRSEYFGQNDEIRELPEQSWISPLMAIYSLPPLRDHENTEAYFSRMLPVLRKRSELAAQRLSVRSLN